MTRFERAMKHLEEWKLEGLLIENPSDVFYLTGQWFSSARLLLAPGSASLLVDGRYFGQARAKVSCEVILAEKEALGFAMKGMKKVGVDSSFVTVEKAGLLQRSVPNKEWIPVPRPLKEMRVCKDSEEIEALRDAARVTAAGYAEVLKKLKEGVEEREIAIEFEYYCRKKGASKMSFEPIVAFGENSAYPHYRAGAAQLKKNQIALFDFGAVVSSYCGDMTRCFFFGQPQEELIRFYGLVGQAAAMAVAAIRPGVKVGNLDRIVREFFAKEGVEHLYSHSLGHGVGIDVHEYPLIRFDGEDRDLILKAGMVFTIEPGLYLPGLGGVRYENTYVVTESGSENLYDEL
jgi:Xaa-Pro aminopeptidase